jgi:cation diffusion facilitator CzcD-associated flavoprotein CzcO
VTVLVGRSCLWRRKCLDWRYWAHGSDAIDFAALHGKTVGVIGAGASAAGNAAEALEAGALRVAMLIRCADVPRSNRGSIAQHIADRAIPPSRESMLRCSRHANFSIIAR